jgi:DNA-binding response OmpR family regulator
MVRILLAEDDLAIRQLVQRVLEMDGHDVEGVADGGSAIEMITAKDYDAIVLDFMMPGTSGLDVVEWIEQNRPEVARSRVIVLTAAVHELQKYDKSKVYAALAKPFDVDLLRDTVRRCVSDQSR